MKRPIYLLSFIISIIFGLTIVQIGVSNQLSTTGSELAVIEDKIDQVKKENLVLNEKVLQASALITIDQKAEQLGFVQAKSPLYLSTPLPLALKQ